MTVFLRFESVRASAIQFDGQFELEAENHHDDFDWLDKSWTTPAVLDVP